MKLNLNFNKAKFKKTCLYLDKEIRITLKQKSEYKDKILRLKDEQERIKKELETKTYKLAKKLKMTHNKRCSLYKKQTTTNWDFNTVLSKKEDLELDMENILDGLK